MLNDPDTRIARPRQVYTGERARRYVPIEERKQRVETPTGAEGFTNAVDPQRRR
ncbi:hypothetical protein HRbin41_01108 [bacterium HR41]|nr:hypothetical protein HRbin41_01108 [bacterium HR41]